MLLIKRIKNRAEYMAYSVYRRMCAETTLGENFEYIDTEGNKHEMSKDKALELMIEYGGYIQNYDFGNREVGGFEASETALQCLSQFLSHHGMTQIFIYLPKSLVQVTDKFEML